MLHLIDCIQIEWNKFSIRHVRENPDAKISNLNKLLSEYEYKLNLIVDDLNCRKNPSNFSRLSEENSTTNFVQNRQSIKKK